MESDQNISIDKLEDQLIDNPDASTTKQLNELSYDETFQKKLNERAEQIFGASGGSGDGDKSSGNFYLLLVTKPYLEYEYRDYDELDTELNDWFVSADFKLLGLDHLAEKAGDFSVEDLELLDKALDSLLYFVLGSYKTGDAREEQLKRIKDNCKRAVEQGVLDKVLDALLKALDDTMAKKDLPQDYLLKLLTITYFVVNVELSEGPNTRIYKSLSDADLLTKLVKLVEEWKINPSNLFRIRNVILLIWKLLLLEFGDTKHLTDVKDYLNKKHDIKSKAESSDNRLTCSPLEYYTFREDLLDKYPVFSKFEKKGNGSYELVDEGEPANDDDRHKFMAASTSNSLSNLLEMPRTNKSHSVLSQLPVSTLHISTPVPSPPSTPSDFMSGGEKVRKLYHVNQSMPFIYPTGSEDVLPAAIKEANELFENAVYESFSVKRLWQERQRYMAQERGNLGNYEADLSEDDNLEDDESNPSAVRSLNRVELFYNNALPYLLSLAKVMIEVVKAYKHDISLRDVEQEINSETSLALQFCDGRRSSYNTMRHYMLKQLEGIRAREITLKASTSIMVLLIKWFKVSHVIKSHYFNSILFDEQYLNVFADFMADSLNNSELHDYDEVTKSFAPNEVFVSQNKLMNPEINVPQFDFFNMCSGNQDNKQRIELINKTPVSKLPSSIDDDNHNVVKLTRYNKNYCHILTNQLQIVNKLLIKGVSQRIFAFIETKPTDLMKFILLNYINDNFKIPILKIFKKIIPFQGRKWRATNMEVISQVFLNLKLTIRDNWLSGRDLESDFNNSFDQEVALRSLLQFYNVRRYPEEMKQLGYTVSTENLGTSFLEEDQ